MENRASKHFYEQWQMLVRDWIGGWLNSLSDEDLKTEISPGKNNGVYILGHLIVSDDDFSKYMGKGGYLFPEYRKMFGQNSKCLPPENYPPVSELRVAWKKVCDKNRKIYEELTDEELEQPHALIEDPAHPEKDYFRTKGRIIMAWQLHQAYHVGQLGVIHAKLNKRNNDETA
jgi:uncharacterized damage-inducible protein DinB